MPQRERQVIGQGSGFVFAAKNGLMSDKTYILTNNHVVADADRILVKFQDGHEYDAKVTGRDPQSDIAVIEIKIGGLPVLSLADSFKLEVGEWVVAIGNPFGLSHTLTIGVVSAKGRTGLGINDYEDFIQTDAAINPGNSGGPLVNLDGEVVGINTAIFSRSGGYMGVGFAIPINLGRVIANQLIEKGEVTRGHLGIMIQSLTPPGSRVHLTILREGKKKDLTITISKLPKDNQVAQGSAQSAEDIGLTVQTLTPQLAEQFDAKPGEGVVVTKVQAGSIAAMAGIELGTVIMQVNRKAVKSAAEFKRAVKENSDKKRVLLLIRKDNMQRYVALSW